MEPRASDPELELDPELEPVLEPEAELDGVVGLFDPQALAIIKARVAINSGLIAGIFEALTS
jgi:hypothetical protein